ncbi:GNAT family N-acetyltransferase [Engelhardtia mirabilis]|uniref:Putative N-acetyltransferase YsnE n=1 Tax=Engelhardtia mirabilis TaxID=2528011 RepID=A0A518BGN5_9BACT|nr:putative N-acetyltransferase YsnE [Planctomycetes bacterium Pla133]QDV00468.1 putative N-acetyltransferase YsnE [Planctomycetes bacterium Pla86]
MDNLEIATVSPQADDVRALVEVHLGFARATTPPEGVHALDGAGLDHCSVALFGGRRGERLVAIGALRELGEDRGELKSMHTLASERGQGIGEAMARHLIREARHRGYRQLLLETGAMDAFAPARALYSKLGFETCGPFGDYVESPTSAFMGLDLT